jgi:hypothetical protein
MVVEAGNGDNRPKLAIRITHANGKFILEFAIERQIKSVYRKVTAARRPPELIQLCANTI